MLGGVELKTENKTSRFKDFLLSEYSNIAQAHFKSIETISTFFRYYLLIMSIPISAVAIFFQISPDKQKVLNIIFDYKLPISIVLFCIYAIGLGVFCFMTNLRMDSILYARVVNGIRKFFYDEWDKDINFKLRMRVLPQSPQLPHYLEVGFFLPVVFVFAIMNTLYATFGSYIRFNVNFYFWLLTTLLFFAHFLFYWIYSSYREIAYLRSNILGVDIDGVLNKHREQFCFLLGEKIQKKVKPDEITVIPVREHPTLGVTRKDEREVFNDPKYWINMDVVEDAADTIRKLCNIFRLKIYIFTYRPWPDAEKREDISKYKEEFLRQCGHLSLKDKLWKLINKSKTDPLRQITKEWLEKHDFLCRRLIFEKGNDYSSDPRGKFRNRFYLARKKKIRFFVEDDLEKAVKLSYICDVVFLFSHPYNEPDENLPIDINKLRESFPSNIIKVKNWTEIYQQIRRLS